MFGLELWWKGDYVPGSIGRVAEMQLLVNQEARATTGCFRTTNLGALSMESGLRAAAAQLENRQRRFGLGLLSLPVGDQAREIAGAPTGIGRRLTPGPHWTDGVVSSAREPGDPRRRAGTRSGS